MTKKACPICGNERERQWRLDYENGVLSVDERMIRLSPQEADVIKYFEQTSERFTARDTLIRAVWGVVEPQDAQKDIRCIIAHIRQKLQGSSLCIINFAGHPSYALVEIS